MQDCGFLIPDGSGQYFDSCSKELNYGSRMRHRERKLYRVFRDQGKALEVMAECHFGLHNRFAVGASVYERWKYNESVKRDVEIGPMGSETMKKCPKSELQLGYSIVQYVFRCLKRG